MSRGFRALLALLLVFFTATAARAQNTAAARPHLRAAVAAARAHDWNKALEEYQAAYAADASNDALAGLASAEFELHHDVEAYAHYTELASHVRVVDAETKARIALLERRTGTITIAVSDPGAEVSLDDVSVGTSPVDVTRRVAQGPHVVRAKPASGSPIEKTVDVAGGGSERVELVLPPPSKAPEPTEKAAASSQQGDAGTSAPASVAAAQADAGAPPPVASGQDAWDIPHGSKFYTAFRTDTPPKIDGVLDERVWQLAPRDARFLDVNSKPYGRPVENPTEVQVAYDDKNLYVAFRCRYAKPGPRDDSFPTDEGSVAATAETVGVLVDALHNHTTAYTFVVARSGARADVEFSDSGNSANLDWRGIWDVAVARQGEASWTVEFRIPWGTMRMPSHSAPFDIGIEFRRRDPMSFETGFWTLPPPATGLFDTHYFGHLVGLRDVHPSQRLYFQPYVSFAYDSTPSTTQSPLTDFTGTNGNARAYAGAYARFQPPGPFRLDATFNPDFSAVNPDQATTNFDRFELQFPEARPFFSEDNPRFQFGAPSYQFGDFAAQMFYSRRIGLYTNPSTGLTEVVPIIWGVKSVLRTTTSDLALMNVGLAPPTTSLDLYDVVSVVRGTQQIGTGNYVGGIILNRIGGTHDGNYFAGGPDFQVSLFDRHLTARGFYAATWSTENDLSGGGSAAVKWASQDFYASGSYFDFGTNFDAQLGFFPVTGIRADIFTAGYTPVIKSDLLQQLFLEAQFTHLTDRSDNRIYDRGVVSATARIAQRASFQVAMFPAAEHVAQDFPIGSSAAANAVTVKAGDYDVNSYLLAVSTPPRRVLVGTLSFMDGDFYGGHRRAPSLELQLNLGRFATDVTYVLNLIHYGTSDFAAHVVNGTATFFYTPLAKSTLVIAWNTLNESALAQLVTSYTFGNLSTISLVLRGRSGSTATTPAIDWWDTPGFSAILSFALGLTPL